MTFLKKPLLYQVGIDEAGRGPWAGPVVAGAVIVTEEKAFLELAPDIKDSKKLSESKRQKAFDLLTTTSGILCSIGEASVEEIDQLNILQATFLAMRRAVEKLPLSPQEALVDGNQDPKLGIPTKLHVDGDQKFFLIAAASIIAKVTRDRIMNELHSEFPFYGWNQNKGYGTKVHQEGLSQQGVTPHHRKSFAPIRKFSIFSDLKLIFFPVSLLCFL